MNKEPIGLYIFRFVLGLGLFAFMAMLYWSSVLLENDMKTVKTELGQLKGQLSTIQDAVSNIHTNSQSSPQNQESENLPTKSQALTLRNRPHIDSSLPNLLQDDPFFRESIA